MKQTRWSYRIRQSAFAGLSALALMAGTAVHADEIIDDDSSGIDNIDSGASRTQGSIDAGESGSVSADVPDSPFLIEDTGQDVQYEAGVPMDTLQDAIDSGDTDTLKEIASLGALTDNPTNTDSGAGVGGGGAYRGSVTNSSGERVDPDEYYELEDLQLDEGDADEIEVDPNSESPGRLIAANSDRVQEYLDSMTQVESPTGSDGELTVASYIETKMGEMGYTVQEQAFHEGVLNEDGIDAPGVNILAERGANSQTNRKRDIFLVVTHYDSKRSPEEGDPFANDKSGAAVLIEAGRILSEVITDTDICFVFLSGEEDGGYGAQNFIASLSEENRSRITGVLSVERVGYDSETPYVLKTISGEANPLGDIVQQLGIANDAHIALTHDVETSDDEDGTWVGVGQSSDGYIDEATAAEIATEQAKAGPADDQSADSGSDEPNYETVPVAEEISLDEEAPEPQGEPVPMPSAWSYLKDSSPTLSTFADQSFTTVTVSQYIPDLDSQSYEETKALGLADTTVEAINEMNAATGQTADGSAEASDASAEAQPQTNADGTVLLEDSNLTGSADESQSEPGSADAAQSSAEADAAQTGAAQADETVQGETEEEFMMDEEALDIPVVDASLVADTTNVIAAALSKIMDPAS